VTSPNEPTVSDEVLEHVIEAAMFAPTHPAALVLRADDVLSIARELRVRRDEERRAVQRNIERQRHTSDQES
jgi:hypothetical protein